MTTWDEIYQSGKAAKYPTNELVRFVAKHFYDAPDRKAVQFADLGAGCGSSTWYLAREGFSVVAVEQSAVAIERLQQLLFADRLSSFTEQTNLTAWQPSEGCFDCAIDIISCCYLTLPDYVELLARVHRSLKPGGWFFSLTPSQACNRQRMEPPGIACRFTDEMLAWRQLRQFRHKALTTSHYAVDGAGIDLLVIEAQK